MPKKTVELSFIENEQHRALEVLVPKGISHKDLTKITIADLITKFRPKGCQTCLSGLDLRIRERFGRVLNVRIDEGAISEI